MNSSWGNDMAKSFINHGDMSLCPDSGVIPNSWFQTSPQGDNVQEIFKALSDSDVQLPVRGNSSMESITEFLCEPEEGRQKRKADEEDMCQSHRESKGKQECVQHKRVRSAQVHNKSERMRRDRIKAKMRALQELIPNCNKPDRASMLDDAIEYLKALKLQVHMMSMGGSALCQVPYISPTSIQTMQVPNFSPVVGIRPGLGFGMGMAGTCYNPGFPMMSATLHPSPSASSSSALPVMSDPQFQVPFFTSPATAPMSFMRPEITRQGESASSSIPTDLQQVPILSQTCISPPVGHNSLNEK